MGLASIVNMCGITGIISFNEQGKAFQSKIKHATTCLNKRGPDAEGIFTDQNVSFGHRRLSIIDVSNAGAQPMTDPSGRFTIVFNGEFFNFSDHRQQLLNKGIRLKSNSDTEVLLHMYILEGPVCLQQVNGFFSLAIYDQLDQKVFLARDRFGVKPFYYFIDEDKLIFASEMKAMLAFGIKKELDKTALFTYLQLNYIPAPKTILKDVLKLNPASWMMVSITDKRCSAETKYYEIKDTSLPDISYTKAKEMLVDKMDQAVQRRLISDVPLGAFLSGGIDSSVITGLASRHVNRLNTFSIGFKDEPLFDETHFARMVADKFKTEHTVFSLKNEDLFEHVFDILEYLDEPFADSSALAVYILSRETHKHVTVALSGDGADELFAGYNKHRAEWILRNNSVVTSSLKLLAPILTSLKGSRNSKIGNKIRQVNRFAIGASLDPAERYWRWCCFVDEQEASDILDPPYDSANVSYRDLKSSKTSFIKGTSSMNDVLRADINLVLPDDMLTKVDRMSMANSLEVRSPFLDFEVVDFACSLPSNFKINKHMQKRLVKDAFRDLLPAELYTRKKQGFEVPLLNWFRTGLRSLIENNLLEDGFIRDQAIFNPQEIIRIKARLFSSNPGEVHARIWGLIVFQYWYRNYFINDLSK